MAPLVSVIIPTGRPPGRANLDRALRSALSQSWRDLDVWVVDDASDPPVRLAPDLAEDPRVHLVRLEKRRGAGGARNLAIERSRGELIALLDDDDAWVEDKIERQLAVLSSRGTDVAAVACAAWREDDHGRRWVTRPPRESRLERRLLFDCCITPSAVIVRRSAFEEVGGFDEELPRMEDWDLWVRLSERHPIASQREVLVLREVREAPEHAIRFLPGMERRLAGRLDRLPRRERDRIRAHHLLVLGAAYARLGERRLARDMFRNAWRTRPSWRLPLYFARTWTGEATWQACRRARDRIMRGSRPGPPAGSAPR